MNDIENSIIIPKRVIIKRDRKIIKMIKKKI